MKITLDHKEARNGVPVMLNSEGKVLPYFSGVRLLMGILKLTPQEFADAIPVSVGTVYNWQSKEVDRNPEAAHLNVMSRMLDKHLCTYTKTKK